MSARDELRGTLSNTICNASFYPERAQPHLLGGDMSEVLDKTADAILAAGYTRDIYLTDEQLYDGDSDTDLPNDTFVESADGSVWNVEEGFGWNCASSGSATLIGPARLLVMGGGQE